MKNSMTSTSPKAFPPLMVPMEEIRSRRAAATPARRPGNRKLPFTKLELGTMALAFSVIRKHGPHKIDGCFPHPDDLELLGRLETKFLRWIGWVK